MTAAIAIASFGAATLAHGSGFLAVVVTAVVLTSGNLPYRAGVQRVHDAVAWLAQIAMFFILGLLVRPQDLLAHAGRGAILAVGLALVARPMAVLLCLAPFRFAWRERIFIAVTGLRGAVPIVLATYPIIRGVPGSEELLELVFVMVAFNSLVPGAVVKPLASWLGVRRPGPPVAPAGIEMVSRADFDGAFISFYVSRASAVAGATVADVPIPESSVVTLIVRGHEVVPPRGATVFTPGDHVYLFVKAEDRAFVSLLFGEEDE
jgi:cell volume regulation protein A